MQIQFLKTSRLEQFAQALKYIVNTFQVTPGIQI